MIGQQGCLLVGVGYREYIDLTRDRGDLRQSFLRNAAEDRLRTDDDDFRTAGR
jgi:hypothetical protein